MTRVAPTPVQMRAAMRRTAPIATAYAAWTSATAARDQALGIEKLRRSEHRAAMAAVFGGIRAAFPNDPKLQDAIVPKIGTSGPDAPAASPANGADDTGKTGTA